jgi:hypothetical protein
MVGIELWWLSEKMERVMSPEQAFATYRRIVARESDGPVWWWYLGTTFAVLEEGVSIPVSHPETVMIYDVESVSNTEFKIYWREVGYFRDPISGEVAVSWFNPETGETLPAPNSFKEGPATYTATLTNSGINILLEQNHAIVRSIDVEIEESNTRYSIVQTERKVRSFPDADGLIRDPQDGSGSEAQTVLSFAAKKSDLVDSSLHLVPVSGTYDFRLDSLPPWMGFSGNQKGSTVVQGIIAKGKPGEKVNQIAWGRLNTLYPDFF